MEQYFLYVENVNIEWDKIGEKGGSCEKRRGELYI